MEEVLSLCGYRCDLCQFYSKNIKGLEDQQRVSRDFERLFGVHLEPANIECVGCKNEGKHADPACKVRPCVLEKGLDNCAHCSEFICDKLQEKIGFTEEYLSKNKKPLSDKDMQSYIKPYQSKETMVKINDETKRT